MNLKNKVVVITGSTGGLGKALASEFISEQAKVIINGHSVKELEKASEEMGAVAYAGDVTKETDMQKLANFAVKKFGKIDIWVNNAGANMPHSSIEKIDANLAHKVMEVNFFGTFFGSRSAMKYMKKQKSGVIVNIVSIRALVPSPISVAYSSSKWAVRGLTEALRMILKPDHVSVIAVHPTGMKTNLFGKSKPTEYKNYMEPSFAARKIVENLKLPKPKEEIIIKKK
jgi:NAD(P)-dependent dehydrogenase (short-subunit alcohol dehydrogenase family)